MRILHTSDWHLGHQLHGLSREKEHLQFLAWLGDTLEQEEVDALLIAGDIFDTAHPSARILHMWYRFLAELQARLPLLQVIVIGGNHDSAARLEITNPILNETQITVIGGVRRKENGDLDTESMALPLRDRQGKTVAWGAAMPFIRVTDLPPQARDSYGGEARLVAGARQLYSQLIDHIRALREPGQALIAMGHCLMQGGSLSQFSERKIFGANQHALPVDIFPDDITYVALGHLHKPQSVGGRENVRYCGSPIPLSLGERDYHHQVCLIDLDEDKPANLRFQSVPRTIAIEAPIRGTLNEVEVAIEKLTAIEAFEGEDRPYLEITVVLDQPRPNLRRLMEEWLEHKAPRLLKLTVEYSGHGRPLDARHRPTLKQLHVEDVFLQCYGRKYEGQPHKPLLGRFHELVEQARNDS